MEMIPDDDLYEFPGDRIEPERDEFGMPSYFFRRDDAHPDKEGNLLYYERLITFRSEITGKNYILYTDYSYTDNGDLAVRGGVFDPDAERPEDTIICLGPENHADWEVCRDEVRKHNITVRIDRKKGPGAQEYE